MILRISSIILLLLFQSAFSQSKKKIDSINAIIIQGAGVSSDSLVNLFQSNINDSRKIDYAQGSAEALAKLSVVYYYQGKYEENVTSMLEAIKLFDSLGLQSKSAHNYGELGYQMKRRDLPKAIYYMQKGKSIATQIDDEETLKHIYNNYGVLKEMNNELDSALYYYKSSLSLKEKQKDNFGIPYSLNNIAGIYVLRKDFEKAKAYLNKALNRRIEMSDSIGLGESYTVLGEVELLTGNIKNAISLLHKSNVFARIKDFRYLEQYNYKSLSEAYKKLNNADSALYYFERSIAIKDSISSIEVEKEVASLRVEFETERKEKELFEQRTLVAEKELEVKKKNTMIFGSLGLALILGLLGYLFYNQQKLKNRQLQKESELKTALAKIETQNRLQEQRLRISRDMHDNIGAQLTFIISSLDNLKYGFKEMDTKLLDRLQGISGFTSQTIYELRDTIWAMNKNEITFEDLQARISNFIDSAKLASDKTKFTFAISSEVDENYVFTSVEGMNIYRIIQEAVNNALKYAEANRVSVNISEAQNKYTVSIQDDGKGFVKEEIEQGNGLNNMKKRASELGGELTLESTLNKGTEVKFTIDKMTA